MAIRRSHGDCWSFAGARRGQVGSLLRSTSVLSQLHQDLSGGSGQSLVAANNFQSHRAAPAPLAETNVPFPCPGADPLYVKYTRERSRPADPQGPLHENHLPESAQLAGSARRSPRAGVSVRIAFYIVLPLTEPSSCYVRSLASYATARPTWSPARGLARAMARARPSSRELQARNDQQELDVALFGQSHS